MIAEVGVTDLFVICFIEDLQAMLTEVIVDAPDQVLLLERWSSSEAQQAHTGTAHFAKLTDVKQRYGLSTKVVRLVVGGA